MLNYIAWQVIPDQVSVPIIGSQQPLHSVGGQISGLLGQLPAVLALNGTEQPLQIIQNSSAWSGPTETRRNAGMNYFDTLGPRPDLGQFSSIRLHHHYPSQFQTCCLFYSVNLLL